MKDIFQRPLESGDFVVYGVRDGNNGGVRVAIILGDASRESYGITEDKAKVFATSRWGSSGLGLRPSFPGTSNMVRVERDSLPPALVSALEAKKLFYEQVDDEVRQA